VEQNKTISCMFIFFLHRSDRRSNISHQGSRVSIRAVLHTVCTFKNYEVLDKYTRNTVILEYTG